MARELNYEPSEEYIRERPVLEGKDAPRITARDSQDKIPCPRCGYRNSNPFKDREAEVKIGDAQTVHRCSASSCRREILYTATRKYADTIGEVCYLVSATLLPKKLVPGTSIHKRRR